jgi:hypothetical protein
MPVGQGFSRVLRFLGMSNPVQSSEIHVSRQISLVDTIISGIVPDTYLSMDAPVLNLN